MLLIIIKMDANQWTVCFLIIHLKETSLSTEIEYSVVIVLHFHYY